jgi:hypothetical protein
MCFLLANLQTMQMHVQHQGAEMLSNESDFHPLGFTSIKAANISMALFTHQVQICSNAMFTIISPFLVFCKG